MQQRERVLALAIGLFAVVLVLYFAFGRYQSMFTTRDARLTKLRKDVDKKDLDVAKVKQALARKRELQERSLPTDRDKARSLYNAWLIGIVDESKLTGQRITEQSAAGSREYYHPVKFNVKGQGSLDQIASLLHGFYSANHLHKITKLDIRPADKSGTLGLDMDVEAISLPGTNRADALTTVPGNNLALANLADYQKELKGRNMFAEHVPPAPPTKADPPRDPSFDTARLAYVTAFMEGRKKEIWLHERNLNKTTRLSEGDQFQVGQIKGTVKRINYDNRRVEMDVEGKLLSLPMNKSLGDALEEQKKMQ